MFSDGNPTEPTDPIRSAGPADPVAIKNAWIIAIGDELLSGRTLDRNSRHLQRVLLGYGVEVRQVAVVRDDPAAIAAALTATEPGGLVFLSGGLGSTPDDRTREAVSAWANVQLRTDEAVGRRLTDLCRQRGIPCGDWVAAQSQVPVGLVALPNPVGTAPGLIGPLLGRTVVVMPGVPGELQGLLPLALRWLADHGLVGSRSPSVLLRTAQMAETALVTMCRPVRDRYPRWRWSWWLVKWGVDIGVTAPPGGATEEEAAELAAELRTVLGRLVFAQEMTDLPEVLIRRLTGSGQSVSVAESCTGGLLGGHFTDYPGSSACFRGGAIVYADRAKMDSLGVEEAKIQAHGAVSRQVAEAMAIGCRERFRSDHALAVTGIAGPEGGTEAKPLGTTWIAAAAGDALFSARYRFPGRRHRVRRLAAAAALDTLRRILDGPAGEAPWFKGDSFRRWP